MTLQKQHPGPPSQEHASSTAQVLHPSLRFAPEPAPWGSLPAAPNRKTNTGIAMPEHVINWDFLHSSPSPQETERLPVYVRLTLRLTRKANVKGMGKARLLQEMQFGCSSI